MIDNKILEGFKERYKDLNPLLFHRSVEKCHSPGDLFDILESIPSFPVVWNDGEHRWEKIDLDIIDQKNELELV